MEKLRLKQPTKRNWCAPEGAKDQTKDPPAAGEGVIDPEVLSS